MTILLGLALGIIAGALMGHMAAGEIYKSFED